MQDRGLAILNQPWVIALLSVLFLLLISFLAISYIHSPAGLQPSRPKLWSNGTSTFAPTTLLISLDGFRADFLLRGLTPTLNSFVANGISPRWMLPSFPSVTFSNHYTLATGLYPESHGIVSNTFWDPDLEEEFTYATIPLAWSLNGGEASLYG